MVSAVSSPALKSFGGPNAEWFQQFLKSGCIFSSAEGTVWTGSGKAERRSQPESGRLSIYAPDFLLTDPRPWLVYEECVRLPSSDLSTALADQPSDPRPIAWSEPSRTEFSSLFLEIQDLIGADRLVKAVLFAARTSDRQLDPGFRARALGKALRMAATYPMTVYGFWTEDGDGMIGATPETLFEMKDDRLCTMALAGTRRLGSDQGTLLEDAKELGEHGIVLEAIVERMKPFGEVTVGPSCEVELPTLVHLHTPISVSPKLDVRFDEWVVALHPTPAIGAWPLDPGWEWLRTHADDRRRYGAPFGMIPPDGSGGRCVVAIRNVQWTKAQARLFAGCGIVAASRLEREWGELHAKLDAIQQALGL